MSRIRERTETLAQTVDRLEVVVKQLLELSEVFDLDVNNARPYDPPTTEAVRSHGVALASVFSDDEVELRRTIVVAYGHDATLLRAAFDGAGIRPDPRHDVEERPLPRAEVVRRSVELRARLRGGAASAP